jgi:hypothetical protein
MAAGSSRLAHVFQVGDSKRLGTRLSLTDQELLSADLSVAYEEPEQEYVPPAKSQASVTDATTEKKRVEEAIQKFQNVLKAGEKLQELLGQRLQTYTVTVDPRSDPSVRTAIRRLFGVDSSTITYEMFKEALRLRSELIIQGRMESYGISIN